MDRKMEARPPALVERAVRLLLLVFAQANGRRRIQRRLDQLERTTEIVAMPSQSHSSAAAIGAV